jgi:hypothetical protein
MQYGSTERRTVEFPYQKDSHDSRTSNSCGNPVKKYPPNPPQLYFWSILVHHQYKNLLPVLEPMSDVAPSTIGLHTVI